MKTEAEIGIVFFEGLSGAITDLVQLAITVLDYSVYIQIFQVRDNISWAVDFQPLKLEEQICLCCLPDSA